MNKLTKTKAVTDCINVPKSLEEALQDYCLSKNFLIKSSNNETIIIHSFQQCLYIKIIRSIVSCF